MGILLFEIAQDARVGAAASCTCNDRVNVTVQRLPDLAPGRFVVGKGVRLVLELVKRDCAPDGRLQLLRLALRTEHAVLAGGVDDLRAKRPHERLLFGGKFCWHNKDQPIAAVQCRKCHAKPGIASRPHDDGRARLQDAALLRIPDHVKPRPVLDAAGRIPELQLGVDVRARGGVDVLKPHEGGAADEIMHRIVNLCHVKPSFLPSRSPAKGLREYPQCPQCRWKAG